MAETLRVVEAQHAAAVEQWAVLQEQCEQEALGFKVFQRAVSVYKICSVFVARQQGHVARCVASWRQHRAVLEAIDAAQEAENAGAELREAQWRQELAAARGAVLDLEAQLGRSAAEVREERGAREQMEAAGKAALQTAESRTQEAKQAALLLAQAGEMVQSSRGHVVQAGLRVLTHTLHINQAKRNTIATWRQAWLLGQMEEAQQRANTAVQSAGQMLQLQDSMEKLLSVAQTRCTQLEQQLAHERAQRAEVPAGTVGAVGTQQHQAEGGASWDAVFDTPVRPVPFEEPQ